MYSWRRAGHLHEPRQVDRAQTHGRGGTHGESRTADVSPQDRALLSDRPHHTLPREREGRAALGALRHAVRRFVATQPQRAGALSLFPLANASPPNVYVWDPFSSTPFVATARLGGEPFTRVDLC